MTAASFWTGFRLALDSMRAAKLRAFLEGRTS